MNTRTNELPTKATAGKDRPTMKGEATAPKVNIHKCDGDGMCVDVCPNGVFEMYTLTDEEIKKLPLLARLKVKIKGAEKSTPTSSLDCDGCGVCVANCHERAIQLVPRQDRSAERSIEPILARTALGGSQS